MTVNRGRVADLYGRQAECRALAERINQTRRGQGGGLVVCGDPGTGKTILLEFAIGLAADLRVMRLSGARVGMSPRLRRLASARRPARADRSSNCRPRSGWHSRSRSATGSVRRPRGLLVGLATVSLLSSAAREQAVLCAIDDVHWLDEASSQALVFAARRLTADPVSLIFSAGSVGPELAGLPSLKLRGLRDQDARDLLASVVRWPLDERVREQIVAETKGNPRTLTELTRSLSPARLAGGFGFPDALPGSYESWLEDDFSHLPASTRLLLVAAAADPTGDPTLLWRASEYLGIAPDGAYPAIEAGLLTITSRVVFRHPAVRSAVYRSASPQDRQVVHQALARATVRHSDQDRRAWHQAHAASGPDEAAAAELERTAGQAQARGGLAAAAAFLERAALLTPDLARRSLRALTAAEVTVQTGEPDATMKLLDMVESELPGEQARADTVRAVTQARTRVGDTPRLLLDAASRLERVDSPGARAAHRDAIGVAITAGGLATAGNSTVDVAREVRRAHRGDSSAAQLLAGLAAWLGGGYAAGVASLRHVLRDFGDEQRPTEQLRWLPLACTAAVLTWDDRVWGMLSRRWVGLSLETGAVADLPDALSTLALLLLVTGELVTAQSLVDEAEAITEITGTRSLPKGAVGLAAFRGGFAANLDLIDNIAHDAAARGEGREVARSHWAAAVMHNSSGHYEEAYSAAENAVRSAGSPSVAGWAMAELIEAAARTHQPGRAAESVRDLSEITSAAGTDWALGIQSRSLALVADGASADALYRTSIECLSRSQVLLDLARARLVYGEWLRRENQRVAAREQLRQAHAMFESMGADGFAERARRELLATGEHSRKRTTETSGDLTAQELQIAFRARDGCTNAAIGRELFLSPRTVEWHLRKVFMKLGITSRRQLADGLAASD